jgi:hypothetical protein
VQIANKFIPLFLPPKEQKLPEEWQIIRAKDVSLILQEKLEFVTTFRELTLLEQAKFCNLWTQQHNNSEEHCLSLLRIKGGKQQLKLLKSTLELSEIEQNCLRITKMDLRSLTYFLRFTPENRQQLAALFQEFPFSRSNLVKVLEQIHDILRRDKISVTEILENCGFSTFCHSDNPPAALKNLLFEIEKTRYPTITATMIEAKKLVKNIPLDKSIQLILPTALEENRLEIRFTVKNVVEIQQKAVHLQEISHHSTLNALMEML